MRLKYLTKKISIFVLLSILILVSCSSDEETTPVVEKEELTFDELEFLRKLATVDKEMDQFWHNFHSLRESPIFIITEPDNGIFINPPNSELPMSRSIHHELGEGLENLNAYRNDEVRDFALEAPKLFALFGFFEYNDFQLFVYNESQLIEDSGWFYFDYKNRNRNFHTSVFFHELFHFHTLTQNGDQFVGDNRIFAVADYPINEESLPLLLLLFDVMIDAYHVEDISEKQKTLEYYVSIQDQLNRLDTTENNLVRHHGFYQEKIEGIARYIEVFSTLETLDNNTIDDPTHGYGEFAENITEHSQIRATYANRIFYHSGAGVIHLLKELGFSNLEQQLFIPEKTPFDLASSFLNLSDPDYYDKVKNFCQDFLFSKKILGSNS